MYPHRIDCDRHHSSSASDASDVVEAPADSAEGAVNRFVWAQSLCRQMNTYCEGKDQSLVLSRLVKSVTLHFGVARAKFGGRGNVWHNIYASNS